MNWKASRREFIAGLTALAGSWAIPAAAFPPFEPLYPPMDLSDFDTPISGAPAEIKVGYAAITWGGNDQRAIEDIAALGFSGIQLRHCIRRWICPISILPSREPLLRLRSDM